MKTGAGVAIVAGMSAVLRRAFPRQPFLSNVDCPHCGRGHVVSGTAPIGEGHRPHYFPCECGRKIMGVVPAGADVASVVATRLPASRHHHE